MNTEDILYYDGSSARPTPVRVLLLDGTIHLRKEEDDAFAESFPATALARNQIERTIYFYLDSTGTRYLQFDAGHPIANQLLHEQSSRKGSWAQRLSTLRISVLLLTMLGLGIGLYLLFVSMVPFLGMRMISVEKEVAIGNQLKEAMLEQSALLGETVDSVGTMQLQGFARQFALSKEYPIEVTLVESNTVNAYALPGGQIVVYSGIINKIETPEEMVALLAHEATHINERHSLRSLLRSAANGILISVVFGDASGISGALISGAETLYRLQYSRSLETEADKKGMDLMVANGVDVKGMKGLMQTLQAEENLAHDLSFISSHPLTKERISAAEKYRNEHVPTSQTKKGLQRLFDSLKSRTAAL
ncbi:M48 family metallopeptidase [Flavisolibacter sp. BT320]|nr:M48 family metallopeptidase [Flavisolibacter longurius]